MTPPTRARRPVRPARPPAPKVGAPAGAPAGGAEAPAAGDAAGDAADAAGTLYVVATPIGNLGDVTLRALEVLRAVPLVAAEDTRTTRRLFARHAIATRLVSHHARSAATRLPELLDHLRGGADLALVTDAGTPLVSDPGDALVAAWAAEGGRIVPIPGASAVLAALVASGVAGPRWSFEGFLPRTGRERRERLARLGADARATVVFEAPSRLAATIADLAATCGAERPAAVCRELTKLHEQVVRGSLASLAAAVASGEIPARGEVVIVVGSRREPAVTAALPAVAGAGEPVARPGSPELGGGDVDAARAEVERLVAAGAARGDAARRVAAATGLPRRRLYGTPADR